MIPSTSRSQRQAALQKLNRHEFEREEEYYFALHMNDRVRRIHSISFLLGMVILAYAVRERSVGLFVLQYLVSTFGSVAAHKYYDGFVPEGPRKTPFRVLYFGIRSNLKFLIQSVLRRRVEDEAFFVRYPHVREVYFSEPTGRTSGLRSSKPRSSVILEMDFAHGQFVDCPSKGDLPPASQTEPHVRSGSGGFDPVRDGQSALQ